MDINLDLFIIKNGNLSKNIFTIGEKNHFKQMFFIEKIGEKDIDYEIMGTKIADKILENQLENCYLDFNKEKLHLIVSGIYLKLWENKYKKTSNPLKTVFISMDNNFMEKFEKQKILMDGIITARYLSGSPANICTPQWVANYISEIPNLQVETLDFQQINMKKMNMLLAVSQGSSNKPYVVKMQCGNDPKIVLLGKGVTFDSGGISIKPARNMHEMMGDMSGAAAVIGAMKVCSSLNIPAVGIVGLVENMPGSKATKPGDIIETPKGTVQILNTDAEGRLVLGDIAHYASKELGYDYIVDIATLTGATAVALGDQYTSMCSNSQFMEEISKEVSDITSEKAHKLPCGKEYDYLVKGEYADYQNIPSRPGAGVIAAAKFIELFVNNKQWLHLDIGETGLSKNHFSRSIFNGYGVRYLVEFVKNFNQKTKV